MFCFFNYNLKFLLQVIVPDVTVKETVRIMSAVLVLLIVLMNMKMVFVDKVNVVLKVKQAIVHIVRAMVNVGEAVVALVL